MTCYYKRTMAKKRKTPRVKKRFRLNKGDLCYLRGMLMAKTRTDIGWPEFCEYLGIKRRYLAYLKTGERKGGPKLMRGVLSLREYGVMVDISDFME